ncbi:MAG: HAD-IA family hydrolase [Candidatus Diapherotrites archaeon]|nr:HAD-IA family hydrolase [Candidatus Diapherotrites archaeon]
MKLKAVIFDLDDTLWKTCHVSYERHVIMAKKLGLRVPEKEEFRSIWGMTWEREVATLWPGQPFESYREAYIREFEGDEYPLHEGANEAIAFAKRKKLFAGIVTSRDRQSIAPRSKQNGFRLDLFDFVFAADDTNVHKPDPKVFEQPLKLLREKGVSAEETLYVGDLAIDYLAAKGNNMQFVAVLSGFAGKKDFVKAGLGKDKMLPGVSSLPNFLLKNGWL